ncbi:MAG: transposase, partial [Candidatus Lokiarchaeota archaeon]|nr:transposase [Candidatus Lokiarchaeota archaeon]MBD3199576.1 transposase [Candidatus Lokiarchaeota archaeon]
MSLNRDLDQYIECVRWYLSFKPTSKQKLHKDAYQKAKQRFELKTALLQSARDKAVEIYTSFRKVKKKGSRLHLRKCCIRFDARSFSFMKTDKEITSYWLHLSLSGSYGRTAFPIIFGERKELIEEALHGEYSIKSVEMKKRKGTWYAHFTLSREV